MNNLKELNRTRDALKMQENSLVAEIYGLGNDDKIPLLFKTKKKRKKTEKMIFSIINNL